MTPSQTPPNTEESWAERRRKLARRQMLFLILLTFFTWAGLFLNRVYRNRQQQELEHLLNGTWELEQVADQSVGAASEILSQKITLLQGKLIGETRIKTLSPAGTTSIPFPDKSVVGYKDSLDGEVTTFQWGGGYAALTGWRVTCKIGAAAYTLNAHWDSKTRTLTLERDFILTYAGPFRYHLIASAPAQKP